MLEEAPPQHVVAAASAPQISQIDPVPLSHPGRLFFTRPAAGEIWHEYRPAGLTPCTVRGSKVKETMMAENISVAGVIGTDLQRGTTSQGKPFVNFRLASTTRRYNDTTRSWEDAGTNWFKVAAYGHIARNFAASFSKGQHVVVIGRLHINEWKSSEKPGITVELVADSGGHDLTWGTSAFTRVHANTERQAVTDAPDQSAEAASAPELISS